MLDFFTHPRVQGSLSAKFLVELLLGDFEALEASLIEHNPLLLKVRTRLIALALRFHQKDLRLFPFLE